MKIPRSAAVCFMLLAGLARVALAQGDDKPLPAPQFGPEIRSRPFLQEPAVQGEIGLTARQREALAAIEAEAHAAREGAVAAPGGGEFDFNAMMEGVDQLARDHSAAIARVLTASQKARLQQIEWQREGWLCLGRPEVATRLKLNRPQATKIEAILQGMQRDQVGANVQGTPPRPPTAGGKPVAGAGDGPVDAAGVPLPGGGPMNFTSSDFEARAAKSGGTIEAVRAEAAREAARILTADQRLAFDRLLGPPFNFKSLDAAPTPGPARAQPGPRGAAGTGAKKG